MRSDQDHLFDALGPPRKEPLAARMRPTHLDECVGQEHIIGPGRLLRRAIIADQLTSLIFYGPPGTGKTTLAQVIAEHTQGHFMSLNAVLSGIAQIRACIEEAQQRQRVSQVKSILFIDEVHRFNTSQQDALLPHVENGTLILIGATTENPFFEVNKALTSRSRCFELRPLSDENLSQLLNKAITSQHGYGNVTVTLDDDAKEHLIRMCHGDARTLFNALELAVEPELKGNKTKVVIDLQIAEESIQKRAVLYDRDGDAHFDTISAFIKSLRGSDPDAGLYWLAKMIDAGEDPRFIFRRMLISASEDVGLANPDCLGQVLACSQAFDVVGLPEGQFHLTQACLLICHSAKSNSTLGYFDALRSISKVKTHGSDIPLHLKDSSRDGEELGHGKGYKYPHAYQNHWTAQQYLPDGLKGKVFYQPSEQGAEKAMGEAVLSRREASWAALHDPQWQDLHIEGVQQHQSHWENHDLNQSQDLMMTLRSIIFECAQIEREDLICDLHAGSGLITLEAARKTKTGGVYAIASSQKEAQTLNHLSQNLAQLSRPEIAIQSDDRVKQWQKDLTFDVLISKQLSAHQSLNIGKKGWKLAKGARVVICEQDLKQEQRLGELIPASHPSFSEQDLLHWKSLESQFYQQKHLQEHNLESLHLQKDVFKEVTLSKKFKATGIAAWFTTTSPLGQWLSHQEETFYSKEAWAEKFKNALAGQTIAWRRVYHFQLWVKKP